MNIYLNFYVGLGIVLLSIIVSLLRWKLLDMAGKIFFTGMMWYFFSQFVAEGGLLYKDISRPYWTFYLIIRDIQAIIELTLCLLFFHFAIPELKAKKIALYLIPAAWAIWIAFAVIFWHMENFNVYFAPLLSITVVILCIVSIHILQSKNEFREIIKLPVFKFVVLLLFYYGFYFFFYVSYPLLLQNRKAELFAVFIIFRLTDIYYVGAGITYFFYPKKTMHLE